MTELSADPAGVVFAKNLELPSTVSTKQEALELCMRAKHIFSSTLFQDVLLFEHDLKSEDAREGVEFLYNLLHSEKPVHSTPAIHVLGAVKKVKTLSKYFE